MRTAKKRFVGGTLALAVALMSSAVGFAQQEGGPRGFGGPGRGGPRGGGGGLGPLARDLNLTDEQKAQMQKLTDSFEESTKAMREQLPKAGAGGPSGELTDGAFDEAAVRAAAQARANVQVELEVARARMMSQVYALLTAEQRAKLAELRQQFEQRRPGSPPPAESIPDGR